MSAAHKELLNDVWGKTTCGDVMPKQNIIAIEANTSIEDACELLSSNKILSAPIWSEDRSEYTGLFDVADMVSFLVTVFKKSEAKNLRKIDLRAVITEGIRALPVPVKWVSDLSLRNPMRTVQHSDPLSLAVAHFAKGVHRVCVIGPEGKVSAILSQSAVARWLEANHMRDVEPITSQPLSALNLVSHHVYTVDANDELLTALEIMNGNGVSSVAVMKDNYLIGSISLSDTKYIFSTHEFEWLWRPCHDFVSVVRSSQAFEHDGKDAAPIFGVRATTTLEFAMKKMRATKAHRVWVVSNDGTKVDGVVSLTDVFRTLNPAQ